MKRFYAILLTALVAFVIIACAPDATPLRLGQTIPLPSVEGRIDHLAVDIKGQRLFVAALGNNTVEVIDLRAGQRVHSIAGLNEPQGIVYIPEANRIFVANGGDGTVKVLDGSSFKLITSLDFKDDADNLRYDATAHRVYVGYGNGAIGIITATDGTRVGDIKLASHPESFQLEKNGSRIFVNVPTAGHVAVIDREKRMVVATWLLEGAKRNFPMALDEASHRLFVGCRNPAKLIVFDTNVGKAVSSLIVDGDTDDIFYDAQHKRISISCGTGFIDVFEQLDADHYTLIGKTRTAPGARTSLVVPELDRLYLAVPHRGNQRAEIRVYQAQPGLRKQRRAAPCWMGPTSTRRITGAIGTICISLFLLWRWRHAAILCAWGIPMGLGGGLGSLRVDAGLRCKAGGNSLRKTGWPTRL